jgi:hypothetical protein
MTNETTTDTNKSGFDYPLPRINPILPAVPEKPPVPTPYNQNPSHGTRTGAAPDHNGG